MTNDLSGKVAVITGAASGIGAATARTFVRQGARVVLGDVNEERLAVLGEELGNAAVTTLADITTEAGVESLVRTAVESFGRLDVLHNNAAAVVRDDLDATTGTDDAWRTTFNFVVMAAVWGARHGIPAMIENGGGTIINMSSGASDYASAAKIAYGSCKRALETFSLYTGAQYGRQGIRSNVVRPGFVLTEGIKSVFNEEQQKQVADASALGRLCMPQDIADVVAFLASSASSYINCAILDVNGGGTKPTVSW